MMIDIQINYISLKIGKIKRKNLLFIVIFLCELKFRVIKSIYKRIYRRIQLIIEKRVIVLGYYYFIYFKEITDLDNVYLKLLIL